MYYRKIEPLKQIAWFLNLSKASFFLGALSIALALVISSRKTATHPKVQKTPNLKEKRFLTKDRFNFNSLEKKENNRMNQTPIPLQEKEVYLKSGEEYYIQYIFSKDHALVADEPLSVGGQNKGMSPYELLLSALAACTSMTLQMYARRKNWPLEKIEIKLRHEKIHAKDCENCESQTGMVDKIEKEIVLHGDLDEAQRQRLLEISEKCPVHRTLTSETKIFTKAVSQF
ncbi:MAG: OsmC family peroxiredoxin [Bdellovibrio sp.]|nr:MAG: OsmC family peroxiredoxin [Bdellovibrio sp.]